MSLTLSIETAARHDTPANPGIMRILVPLDGSPLAERALQPAIALARACHAELVLLRAIDSKVALPSGSSGWFLSRHAPAEPSHLATLYLARQEEALRSQGVRVSSHVLYRPPVDAIIELAAHGPVDLIVMATHGPRGTDARIPSSPVAAAVLRHARTPTLLVTAATSNPFDLRSVRAPRIQLDAETAVRSGLALLYAEVLANAFGGEVLSTDSAWHDDVGAVTFHAVASSPSPDLLIQGGLAWYEDQTAAIEEALRIVQERRVPLLFVP